MIDTRINRLVERCQGKGIEMLQSFDIQKYIDEHRFNFMDITQHIISPGSGEISFCKILSATNLGGIAGIISCLVDPSFYNAKQFRFVRCIDRRSIATECIIFFPADREEIYIHNAYKISKLKAFL